MDKQRQTTLDEFFSSSPASLRPMMTSLNGDNSWLFSFPRPSSERKATGRAYFHVVFEPWLAGPATTFTGWFIWMSLTVPPGIPDSAAVEEAASQIEEAALRFLAEDVKVREGQAEADGYDGYLDAILLANDQADHVHPPTLRTFHKSIPVVATSIAAKVAKSLNYFESITVVPTLDATAKSWQNEHAEPLPSWLNLLYLPGSITLNFSLAIIWTHQAADGSEKHETILHTPHGTPLDRGPLQAFLDAEPPTEKLAMLHGLKESTTFGIQTTSGVRGGLNMYRKIGGTKYWLLTHHGVLAYAGGFMRLARVTDTERTLEWGLEDEEQRCGKEVLEKGGIPNVVEVQNGGCFVLA